MDYYFEMVAPFGGSSTLNVTTVVPWSLIVKWYHLRSLVVFIRHCCSRLYFICLCHHHCDALIGKEHDQSQANGKLTTLQGWKKG